MPYKDKEKQRAFQREFMRKRRQEWFDANGPCQLCGSAENLELDHIDPEMKVASAVWSWSKQRAAVELAKCRALCKKCHAERTKQQLTKPVIHGTYGGWRRGCRCAACHGRYQEVWKSWPSKQKGRSK